MSFFGFAMLLVCMDYAEALRLSYDAVRTPDYKFLYRNKGKVTNWDDIETIRCEEFSKHVSRNKRFDRFRKFGDQKQTMETCLTFQKEKAKYLEEKKRNDIHLHKNFVRGMRSHKPYYFHHISKSAGSMVWNCAKMNGERVPDEDHFGHQLDEDAAYWASNYTYPIKSTCPALHKKFLAEQLTFEENENFLHKGKLCSEFENVLIMRDPIHRLASFLQFVSGRAKDFSLKEIKENWPWQLNNYASRGLGGQALFESKIDNFQDLSDHSRLFDKLIETIHKFDVVLIADSSLSDNLHTHFGWDCSSAQGLVSELQGGTQGVVDHWAQNWPKEDFERLKAYNDLDHELFKEAQTLSLAQSLQKKFQSMAEAK